MPYRVERVKDAPIILVTYHGPRNEKEEVPAMCREVDAQIRPDESKVFCIHDVSALAIDFSAFASGLAMSKSKLPGSSNDSRIQSILVGSGVLWEIASKTARHIQGEGGEAPLFSTVEEALAYAREKIKS